MAARLLSRVSRSLLSHTFPRAPATSITLTRILTILTMSSQKSIKSYFTPSKRPRSDEPSTPADDGTPSKKKKATANSTEAISNDTSDTHTPAKAKPNTPKKENNSQNGASDKGDQVSLANSKIIQKRIEDTASKFVALSPNIGHSWFVALEPEFKKKYFATLSSFLANERSSHTVYPPPEDVYSWTRHCKIKDVKVVILGQDPYHGPKQAHGLCFSVQKGVSTPPSLLNMYKELQSDIKNFKPPFHGNLIGWAKQGVLLLNACLTVRASQANSHSSRGWENLTDAVIKWLNGNCNNLVFILWGSYAQKKSELIDSSKHLVLKSAHPSPLSASRGFFGCKHFSKANEFLVKKGKKPIDWCELP